MSEPPKFHFDSLLDAFDQIHAAEEVLTAARNAQLVVPVSEIEKQLAERIHSMHCKKSHYTSGYNRTTGVCNWTSEKNWENEREIKGQYIWTTANYAHMKWLHAALVWARSTELTPQQLLDALTKMPTDVDK